MALKRSSALDWPSCRFALFVFACAALAARATGTAASRALNLPMKLDLPGVPMLWLKAFHVVFVVTWFAGLFYLPRLFVYHVGADQPVMRERLAVMERRLFTIMTIGAALALAFGVAMILAAPQYLQFGWLRLKLALVGGLIAYHIWCRSLMVALRSGRDAHSQRWFRFFNELPGLLLIAIVVLAVVKPSLE
jgi:putative membrane protein